MADMMHFRYGRKAPKRARALALGPVLSGTIPPPPAAVDYGTAFNDWQMLGNDTAGDCVAVTWANQRAMVTTVLGTATAYPSQDEVWQVYKTQNPSFDPNGSDTTNGPGSSADGGMDIQTTLEYLASTGGPDGSKAVAFAQVDYTNEAELRSAHAIFGQVWYGINVQKANEQEFHDGKPWNYVAGSPNVGGHSITGVGYSHTDFNFITWAQETEWTEAFRTHLVEEAWVVIWPEHLGTKEFQTGINLTQLAADYQTLTGRPLVMPQASTQDNWRMCGKCDSLVFAGQSTAGMCAAGGRHDTSASADYVLSINTAAPSVVNLTDARQPQHQ